MHDDATLKRPNGFIVGVHEVEADWSFPPEEVEEAVDATTGTQEVTVGTDEEQEEAVMAVAHSSNMTQCPYFETEGGGRIYKSTCCKNICQRQTLSADRLRRMEGLTRYPYLVPGVMENDNVLWVGEPVIFPTTVSGSGVHVFKIGNIMSMTDANKAIKYVDLANCSLAEMSNLEMIVKMLILHDSVDGRKLLWDGKLDNIEYKVAGACCLAIKADIDANEGQIKYSFERSLLLDVSTHLQIQVSRVIEEATPCTSGNVPRIVKKKCKVCSRNVIYEMMRVHVAGHIAKGDVLGASICGFCGTDTGCATTVNTSSSGPNKYYSLRSSDCPYKFFYKRLRKVWHQQNNPCTNRAIECPEPGCKSVVWTYCLFDHYELKHVGKSPSSSYIVSEREREYVASLV